MNKQAQEPIPSLEFYITEKCNYRCEYCVEDDRRSLKNDIGHAPDNVMEAFIDFINGLDEPYNIKLIGGEPLVHPRFFELVEKLAQLPHTLAFTTNFSYSLDHFKRIADLCGEQLVSVGASLHLSQVNDLDKFIAKAIEFDHYVKAVIGKSVFYVSCVVTEENFATVKKVDETLTAAGVSFSPVHLKSPTGYYHYPEEIQAYINPRIAVTNVSKIKDFKSFGTLCYTGCKFFNIHWDGSVKRCFNYQWGLPDLGNIADSSFKPFDGPRPCYSPVCTCVTPANRNMIVFGEKNSSILLKPWRYILELRFKAARRLKRYFR